MNGLEYLCLGGLILWIISFGLCAAWVSTQVTEQDRGEE